MDNVEAERVITEKIREVMEDEGGEIIRRVVKATFFELFMELAQIPMKMPGATPEELNKATQDHIAEWLQRP